MTYPDLKVRRAVAQEHGLDWPAAKLLVGETIPELEESAAGLAALLRERDEQAERVEQLRAPSGFFERARIEKAERQAALMGALCGRTQQPRDEAGKFAAADDRPAVGFDGGVREPVRRIESHESWLAAALGDRRADVGANL